MAIQTLNPATGEVVKTFDAHTEAQTDAAIAKSLAAHHVLRDWSFEKRAKAMRKAAKILKDETEHYAKILTLEMGKTFASAKAEVEKCAWVCEHYADNAQDYLADEIVETDAKKSYRTYLPLGPVLAVMPWNYPYWQAFRFAAPALMAGNTGLLKHSSNVPQSALAISEIFDRAGFPEGAFQTLLIGGSAVEHVLRDPRVRAATLTGSEPAGSSVAAICGELIKPTVLELGGSDAFIIMPSADIDEAVKVGTKARTQNNGQSCIAAKRFLVHEDIYDDVKAKFVDSFKALKVGEPMKEDTDVGPLVTKQARKDIAAQVEMAITQGARRVFGAEIIDGKGFYFRPGILDNIEKGNLAYSDEIFGPVALFFKVSSLSEAIKIANDTEFGLGSAIFTADEDEQQQAIRQIEAGATFVNSMTSSDPRLPFGGIKVSGYGRELSSEGIRAFCNCKTVSIAH
ncbi:NAD-dependent succinate-semialdehyde dehydrogenase [Robiginitomaculum antarcticum]|uniref:NAD-dependent succinate-semialdehyde dehydrogenase n=1 Tax=Robiginitomaculum antarcticum TaxID=437507 RepID=UPI0003692EB6|nr:NAD-dependent succinate-semialdehyde dehydrogenase [Robiginitomaculum antarcticum]